MKRILTLALAVFLFLPIYAAKKVSAPYLTVNEKGGLVVANPSGKYIYKYSITNAGEPSQPETVIPADGLKLTSSGTYNIIVTAENKKGKVLARTNACYHVYGIDKPIESSFKIAAESSDSKMFAPFTITNTGKFDLIIGRGAKGRYWKFDKKIAGADVMHTVEIGIETLYASNVSFYIRERMGDGVKFKKVYVYYDGKSGEPTGYGIDVPSPVSTSVAEKYALIWELGAKGLVGKRVHFRLANASEASSWSVLEQGFTEFR